MESIWHSDRLGFESVFLYFQGTEWTTFFWPILSLVIFVKKCYFKVKKDIFFGWFAKELSDRRYVVKKAMDMEVGVWQTGLLTD